MTNTLYAPLIYSDKADGSLYIEGVCSTERVLDSDYRVLNSALQAAIDEYMEYPAVREMHESSAGKALGFELVDGRMIMRATIVDPGSILKIREGVLTGLSIGFEVLSQAGKDVTRLRLIEVSVVDRPRNRDCAITLYQCESSIAAAKEPAMAQSKQVGVAEQAKAVAAKATEAAAKVSAMVQQADGAPEDAAPPEAEAPPKDDSEVEKALASINEALQIIMDMLGGLSTTQAETLSARPAITALKVADVKQADKALPTGADRLREIFAKGF